MSKDEEAAAKGWKDYHDNGIVKYGLDDIPEYNSTKEHMQAAYFTGFYAGRNYQRDKPLSAENLAERFHKTYEKLAPDFGYKTREDSSVDWADVPDENKKLMIATCEELIDEGIK